MEKFSCDGIVLKTAVSGESHLLLWILTEDSGIIKAFSMGARGVKNKLHSGSAQFVYATFYFSRGKNALTVTDIKIHEVFFGLRSSLKRLAVSQYMCEALLKSLPDGRCDGEIMRLLLNSLYFLSSGKKDELLVKAVFELRYASEAGFMPSLVGCDGCGEYESEKMYFSAESGKIYCEKCGGNGALLPLAVITAMRHIVFSEFEKCFSFTLSSALLPAPSDATGRYLANMLDMTFGTLSFI